MARDAGGPATEVRVTAAIRLGFEGLDFVDLRDTFRVRAHVMSALRFLKGPYRSAMRLVVREASTAFSNRIQLQSVRAWKLFLLLPRMILWKPSRGGLVPKGKLQERFAAFARGDWGSLSQSVEASSLQLPSDSVANALEDSVEQRAESGPNHWRSWARTELLVRLAMNRRSEPSWTRADVLLR